MGKGFYQDGHGLRRNRLSSFRNEILAIRDRMCYTHGMEDVYVSRLVGANLGLNLTKRRPLAPNETKEAASETVIY